MLGFYKKRYEKFNILSKSLRIIRNILFGIIFGYLGIMIFLTVIEDCKYNFVMSSYLQEKAKYVQVITRPSKIDELNGDGTINGINLALISQLNEGYLKDYLSCCKKNYEGSYNSEPSHVSVDLVLATVFTEQGGYNGSNSLPISLLPWDSSSNSPLWNKPYGSYPAEAFTLEKANNNVFSGIYGKGSVVPEPNADVMSGGTYGPFQITPNETDNSQKANINGYNSDGSRSFDMMYFPDQLSHLDHRLTLCDSYFDMPSLSDEGRSMAWGLQYNPGCGAMAKAEIIGTDAKSAERNESVEEYVKDLRTVYEKYGSTILNIGEHNVQFAAVALCLMHDCGWKSMTFNQSNILQYSYLTQKLFTDVPNGEEFIRNNSEEGGYNYYGVNRSFAWFHKKGKYDHYSDLITVGHAFNYCYLGKVRYAQVLQMGGVSGVDPTNPSSYMNVQKSNGQWTPDGNSDWMKEAQVDMNKLNDKRAKLIQTAYSVLGNPYVWGGETWPNQKPDGTFDITTGGMDCSGYVMNVYKRALGVDITRTTYTQPFCGLLEQIPPSEAKPGDLAYYGSPYHHVLMYLGGDPNDASSATFIHDPKTGDVIKIGKYYAVCDYYRLKGIDN